MSTTDTDSVYAQLVAASATIENHASDLYVPVTPATMAVVRAAIKAGKVSGVTIFTHNVTGLPTYDIPFAYLPYWEAKQARR